MLSIVERQNILIVFEVMTIFPITLKRKRNFFL